MHNKNNKTAIMFRPKQGMILILSMNPDMRNFKKLAGEKEAQHHLSHGVAERLLLPFFFSKEDYQHPISMWNQFFYQCQPMAGAADYYHAIFHGRENQHINKDKIIPYATHNPASGIYA
jgi:hypothetical protein